METLERNRAIGAPAGTLTCRRGVLWITWEGSPDIVLREGESVEIPGGVRAVVEALRGIAAFETSPSPAAGPQAFLRPVAGEAP